MTSLPFFWPITHPDVALMSVFDSIGNEIGDDLLNAAFVNEDWQCFARTVALEFNSGFLYTLAERLTGIGKVLDEVYLLRSHLHGIGVNIRQDENVVDKS